MKEVVAARPLDERRKSSLITITTRNPFILNNEAGEPKSLLTGTVHERPVSLIERPLDQRYVTNWDACHRAGLPVVPTLRTTPNNTMLLTDVKADGSEVYGKNLLFVLQQDLERERPRPDIDAHFTKLMEEKRFTHILRKSSLKQIQKKAMEYAQRATDHHILLPQRDAFELVVHPDGSWDLVILDLNQVKINVPLRGGKLAGGDNIARTENSLAIMETIPGALRGEKIVF